MTTTPPTPRSDVETEMSSPLARCDECGWTTRNGADAPVVVEDHREPFRMLPFCSADCAERYLRPRTSLVG